MFKCLCINTQNFQNTLHIHISVEKMTQNGDMHMQMFKMKIKKIVDTLVVKVCGTCSCELKGD